MPKTKVFEYKKFECFCSHTTNAVCECCDEIKKLGLEGWELVSVVSPPTQIMHHYGGNDTSISIMYWFKREVVGSKEA